MSVKYAEAYVPVTEEVLADAVEMTVLLTVALTQTPRRGRYHRVWQDGYWQAIRDIRAGRIPGFVVDEAWRTTEATR